MGYEKLTKEKDTPICFFKKGSKMYFDNAFCLYGSEICTLKILLCNDHFCYDSAKKLSQTEAWKVLEIMYKHQPQLFTREFHSRP